MQVMFTSERSRLAVDLKAWLCGSMADPWSWSSTLPLPQCLACFLQGVLCRLEWWTPDM